MCNMCLFSWWWVARNSGGSSSRWWCVGNAGEGCDIVAVWKLSTATLEFISWIMFLEEISLTQEYIPHSDYIQSKQALFHGGYAALAFQHNLFVIAFVIFWSIYKQNVPEIALNLKTQDTEHILLFHIFQASAEIVPGAIFVRPAWWLVTLY